MLDSFLKMLKEMLQDNATGRYSHSRFIALLVAIAATIFMWKLILLGGLNIEYFIAYLAYGTGYQTMNKFLDNRDRARIEQSRTVNSVQQSAQEPINSPKETQMS